MVKIQARKKRITMTRRFGRLHVFGIVAVLVVAISTVTALSRQSAPAKPATVEKAALVTPSSKNYVQGKPAGQDIHVDGPTGEIQELTPEEAQKLAAGLKPMLNKSSDGLVEQHNPDGSVSLDLQGRFQNVTVARVNKDGTVTQSCVDNASAAGKFFGIDPKLIENSPAGKPRANSN